MTLRKHCGTIPHHRKTMTTPKQKSVQCALSALQTAQSLSKNDPTKALARRQKDAAASAAANIVNPIKLNSKNDRAGGQGRLPNQSNCKGLLGSTCAVTPSRDMATIPNII